MKPQKTWILKGSIALVGIVLVGCVVGVSQQVEREWQTASYSKLEIGVTKSLTVRVLFEKAVTREDLQAGFGVSYLVKTDQSTILLDMGNNREKASPSPVEHNMQTLGVTLDEIDFLREREPHLFARSPHDSGLAARRAFRNAFPEAYQIVEVGQEIRLESP